MYFFYQWIVFGHIRVTTVFPQHHVTIGRHHAGAKRIMCIPELHVRGIGSVSNRQRIEQEYTIQVARLQVLDNAIEPILTHRWQIRTL